MVVRYLVQRFRRRRCCFGAKTCLLAIVSFSSLMFFFGPSLDYQFDIMNFITPSLPSFIETNTFQSVYRHMTECPSFNPGKVHIFSNMRSFCFGTANIPGQRLCNKIMPDYTQKLNNGFQWLQTNIRGTVYLIRPYFIASKISDDLYNKDMITISTQGSWNRLHYILPLVERWRGPIEVALLLNAPSQLETLRQYVDKHDLIKQYVNIHIVYRHGPSNSTTDCGHSLNDSETAILLASGIPFRTLLHITVKNNAYMYKCQTTCIGYGAPLSECHEDEVICGRDEKYGSLDIQAANLILALQNDAHIHPNCPMRNDHYPINLLRNVAQQHVRTRWIMVSDIDAIPNGCMSFFRKNLMITYQHVLDNLKPNQISCPGLYAFISPAIEIKQNLTIRYNQDKEYQTCEFIDKNQITDMMYRGKAGPMHMHFAPGYMPTQYINWLTKTTPYEVPYTLRFEPYYIALNPVPLFDESFVDRGGNFAQQVLEMYASGYRFFVIPNVFVVDTPHTNNGPKHALDNPKLSKSIWKKFYWLIRDKYGVYKLLQEDSRLNKTTKLRLQGIVDEYYKEIKKSKI